MSADKLVLRLFNPVQAFSEITRAWKEWLKPKFLYAAADGVNPRYVLEIRPETRSLEQNAKFHAICSDIAKSGLEWAGKRRTAAQWKVLLVSGHAVATKEESEIVPGLEGEFINIRESTALMSVKRGASLIEYALAFCAMHGVPVRESATSIGEGAG